MRRFNIRIEYIEGTKNVIADGLLRTIFGNEVPEILYPELANEIIKRDSEGDAEWCWKDGKRGYEEMLREMYIAREQLYEQGAHQGCEQGTELCERGRRARRMEDELQESKQSKQKLLESANKKSEQSNIIHTENNNKGVNTTNRGSQKERKIGKVKARRMELVKDNRRPSKAAGISGGMTGLREGEMGRRLLDRPTRRWKFAGEEANEERELREEVWGTSESGEEERKAEENRLLEEWRKDRWYGEIVTCLTDGWVVPKRYKHSSEIAAFRDRASHFRYHYGVGLIRQVRAPMQTESLEVPCVREEYVRDILREAHDESGHFGWEKMMKILRNRVWWKDMSSDVRVYVDGCLTCAKFGPAIRSHQLHPFITYKPFDVVGIDFIGPLEESAGKKYILHMIDYFTRFTKAWALTGDTPLDAAGCLSEFCYTFQAPIAIYHDPGTHFTSDIFRSVCKEYNIADLISPSGASKSTGMIERANRVLEDCLKKECEGDLKLWSFRLPYATHAVNTRVVTSTGFTPFELLFGIPHRMPFETAISSKLFSRALGMVVKEMGQEAWEDTWEAIGKLGEENAEHQLTRINDQRKKALVRSIKAAEDMKERYDWGITGREYKQGDMILLWDTTVGKGIGKKLAQTWTGPFQIQEKIGNVTYKLRHLHGPTIPGVFHEDHLHLFQQRKGYLAQPGDEIIMGPENIRRIRKRYQNAIGKKRPKTVMKTNRGRIAGVGIVGHFWSMVENQGILKV